MINYQQVYWHSGLYLQPQHFQLTDLQHQYWHYRFSQLGMPFLWGVISFELDQAALLNDELSARQVVLLFQDGALVDCSINAVLSPYSLGELWSSREQPMPLYVGLRKLNPEQSNVTNEGNTPTEPQEIKRWTLQDNARVQPDLFGDGPDADLHTLSFHLRFFLQEQLSETSGYMLLRVGQLRSAVDGIVFDEHEMVPCLSLEATPAIKRWVNIFCRTVHSKIRRLEGLKRQGFALSKYTPDEFNELMAVLQVLCRYSAKLECLRQGGQVHPWYFYGVVKQLNIELLCLTPATERPEDSEILNTLALAYDHYDMGTSLNHLSDQFDRIINKLLNIPGFRITFRSEADGYYIASLDKNAMVETSTIYLCLNSMQFSDQNEDFIKSENIKLCPQDVVNELINYSLPGIPLSYLTRLPHNLSVRDDTYCFRLDSSHALWSKVIEVKSIIFYWINAPADLQVELVWTGEQ